MHLGWVAQSNIRLINDTCSRMSRARIHIIIMLLFLMSFGKGNHYSACTCEMARAPLLP